MRLVTSNNNLKGGIFESNYMEQITLTRALEIKLGVAVEVLLWNVVSVKCCPRTEQQVRGYDGK